MTQEGTENTNNFHPNFKMSVWTETVLVCQARQNNKVDFSAIYSGSPGSDPRNVLLTMGSVNDI